MTFHYEELLHERFQHLSQALIVREYPGTQCFPVSQPDGGRDAWQILHSKEREVRVFQVKYSRAAHRDDVEAWIDEVGELESSKVSNLIQRGYTIAEYILVTNAHGTAHPQVGSIDRLSQRLSEILGVPTTIWWRDDLDRRCEAYADIRWAYPEILRGSDVLAALASSMDNAFTPSRKDALRRFIIEQCDEDSQVRFKQVELSNDLLNLFIDVPAQIRMPDSRQRAFLIESVLTGAYSRLSVDSVNEDMQPRYNDSYHQSSLFDSYEEGMAVGAAAMLLDEQIGTIMSRVILDGGPGQGKSTLLQYVCQVHRLQLLSRPEYAFLPAKYQPKAARYPIRVDLREYATWLSGRNPFASDNSSSRPAEANKSLESFIAALIAEKSGGMRFTVNDLTEVARESSLLIALDGLDEVGDVNLRNNVVNEISSATRRLKDSAASLQVVVTTRPSALSEVASFPSRLFDQWSLASLTKPLIMGYAKSWIKARRLNTRDASDITKALDVSLSQTHMRELARNPMQLTILLSLIHTRGSSLPDKRTRLYDLYVDLFLARESDKSDVVKQYRDELIDIHRYLAWTLHSEAETGGTLGRIDAAKLRQLLTQYLHDEGRDTSLANDLFSGVVQRVVFIVESVEGQYEFEVQPLREYFVGRFLYETAPYSPPGDPRRGTKDDIFDAVARNTYWQNATRFYAGCFSKGELPSLVDRLQVLCEDRVLGVTSYPRSLAATLTSDWVFSQNQRSLRQVIEIILNGDGYRSLLSEGYAGGGNRERLVLADGCGREELINRCFEVLLSTEHRDVRTRVANLATANASQTELKARWLSYTSGLKSNQMTSWLQAGYYLGAFPRCSAREFASLWPRVAMEVSESERWGLLAQAGKLSVLDSLPEERESYISFILNGYLQPFTRQIDSTLSLLTFWIGQYFTALGRFHNSRSSLRENLRRLGNARLEIEDSPGDDEVSIFGQALLDLLDLPIAEWQSDEARWNDLITKYSAIRGETWTVFDFAAIAALRLGRERRDTSHDVSLFNANIPILSRLRQAYNYRGSVKWWIRQLDDCSTDEERQIMACTAIRMTGPNTLIRLMGALDECLSQLNDRDAGRFIRSLGRFGGLREQSVHGVSVVRSLPEALKERAAAIFGYHLSPPGRIALRERYLKTYDGNDPLVLTFLLNTFSPSEFCDDEHWARYVEISRKAYIHDRSSVVSERLSRSEFPMTLKLAQEIARRRSEYPCLLVTIAENRCLRAAGQEAVPLSEIAREQGWFGQG